MSLMGMFEPLNYTNTPCLKKRPAFGLL